MKLIYTCIMVVALFFYGLFAPLNHCSQQVPFIKGPALGLAQEQIYLQTSYNYHYLGALRDISQHQDYRLRLCDNPLVYLGEPDTLAVEAYWNQAYGLLDKEQYYWYPHYSTSVIFARVGSGAANKKYADIDTWEELISSQAKIGLVGDNLTAKYLLMALAYGLSGSLDGNLADAYYEELKKQGRIEHISQLYQATKLRDLGIDMLLLLESDGRALQDLGYELVLVRPAAGTLNYTKGLLTKKPWPELGAASGEYLAKHKLLTSTYGTKIQEQNHFNKELAKISLSKERLIFDLQDLSFRGFFSSLGLYLLYIVAITMLILQLQYKINHPGIRQAVRAIGLILVVWILTNISRFYLPEAAFNLKRYLWYAYYLYILLLTLLFLYISQAENENYKGLLLPWLLRLLLVLDLVAVAAVFTNDYHERIFAFPQGLALAANYSHGIGYYALIGLILLQFFASTVELYYKALCHNIFQPKFLWPLLPIGLFALYYYGYVTGDYYLLTKDFTLIYSLLFIMYLALAIGSGLINCNSGYYTYFYHSKLALELYNKQGQAQYYSQAVQREPSPYYEKIAYPITGGTALYYKDITGLAYKQQQLEQVAATLQNTYKILKEQETILAQVVRTRELEQLYKELEAFIETKEELIKGHYQILMEGKDPAAQESSLHGLSFLASYIKKYTLLLLKSRDNGFVSSKELEAALTELNTYAKAWGMGGAITYRLQGHVYGKAALCLCGFFASLTLTMAEKAPLAYLASIKAVGSTVELVLTPEELPTWLQQLLEALQKDQGSTIVNIALKDLGYSQSITIILQGKKEEADD